MFLHRQRSYARRTTRSCDGCIRASMRGGDGGENSMTGDPHVIFGGKRTTIHLPTHHSIKLFEQGNTALYAQGAPNEDGLSMNHMSRLSVYVGGKPALAVEQKLGTANKSGGLMNLWIDGTPSAVIRDGLVANGAFQVKASRERVAVRRCFKADDYEELAELASLESPFHHRSCRIRRRRCDRGSSRDLGSPPTLTKPGH
eukprot:TRINITY_DN6224_c0_g1_i2.p1 TRINITY_DN6224_c0_g1~~TRINITY_DN6224_c0_g1_i2.p1  ORF type:complete len:200 (+),score=6.67 TRINITY_DN6224_c0_g1_i2:270-869(+)